MTGRWRVLDGPAGPLHSYTAAAGPGPAHERVLVVCHELPRVRAGAAEMGRTLPSLADRVAQESGWRVVTATLRGSGGSAGDFSAAGWIEDLRFLLGGEAAPGPVVVAGFGLGGVLALRLAADRDEVAGVAALAAPSDPGAWAADPARFLAMCRQTGVVSSAAYPADLGAWAAEVGALDPMGAAAELGSRPLLVVHGSADGDVPVADAQAIAEAAPDPGSVELRIVPGAGHWLRADPRVVATLIGWIERQR